MPSSGLHIDRTHSRLLPINVPGRYGTYIYNARELGCALPMTVRLWAYSRAARASIDKKASARAKRGSRLLTSAVLRAAVEILGVCFSCTLSLTTHSCALSLGFPSAVPIPQARSTERINEQVRHSPCPVACPLPNRRRPPHCCCSSRTSLPTSRHPSMKTTATPPAERHSSESGPAMITF